MKLILSTVLIWSVLFSPPNESEKNDDFSLADFEITIERDNDYYRVISDFGTPWLSFGFGLSEEHFVVFSNKGKKAYSIDKINSYKPSSTEEFLFLLRREADMICLDGIQGTAWLELGFTVKNCDWQTFDEYGTK